MSFFCHSFFYHAFADNFTAYFQSNFSCRARHPIIMKNYNSVHSLACHSFRNLCTCILIHMNGQLGALHPRTKILKRMTVRNTPLCDSYFQSNSTWRSRHPIIKLWKFSKQLQVLNHCRDLQIASRSPQGAQRIFLSEIGVPCVINHFDSNHFDLNLKNWGSLNLLKA